jgi:hypothetical protein
VDEEWGIVWSWLLFLDAFTDDVAVVVIVVVCSGGWFQC